MSSGYLLDSTRKEIDQREKDHQRAFYSSLGAGIFGMLLLLIAISLQWMPDTRTTALQLLHQQRSANEQTQLNAEKLFALKTAESTQSVTLEVQQAQTRVDELTESLDDLTKSENGEFARAELGVQTPQPVLSHDLIKSKVRRQALLLIGVESDSVHPSEDVLTDHTPKALVSRTPNDVLPEAVAIHPGNPQSPEVHRSDATAFSLGQPTQADWERPLDEIFDAALSKLDGELAELQALLDGGVARSFPIQLAVERITNPPGVAPERMPLIFDDGFSIEYELNLRIPKAAHIALSEINKGIAAGKAAREISSTIEESFAEFFRGKPLWEQLRVLYSYDSDAGSDRWVGPFISSLVNRIVLHSQKKSVPDDAELAQVLMKSIESRIDSLQYRTDKVGDSAKEWTKDKSQRDAIEPQLKEWIKQASLSSKAAMTEIDAVSLLNVSDPMLLSYVELQAEAYQISQSLLETERSFRGYCERMRQSTTIESKSPQEIRRLVREATTGLGRSEDYDAADLRGVVRTYIDIATAITHLQARLLRERLRTDPIRAERIKVRKEHRSAWEASRKAYADVIDTWNLESKKSQEELKLATEQVRQAKSALEKTIQQIVDMENDIKAKPSSVFDTGWLTAAAAAFTQLVAGTLIVLAIRAQRLLSEAHARAALEQKISLLTTIHDQTLKDQTLTTLLTNSKA